MFTCRWTPRRYAASRDLARIRVDEAEVATLQQELNAILGYVEQFDEVNVDGVEPLSGGAQMALRDARGRPDRWRHAEQILANAPDRTGRTSLPCRKSWNEHF